MTSLDQAWGWYLASARQLRLVQRLGRRYWPQLQQDERIGLDDHVKLMSESQVQSEAEVALGPLDDLAVVVLFSVFESEVREYVTRAMLPEAERLSNPVLKAAAEDAVRGAKEGSFYSRVLEPLKKQGAVPTDLVTQVDQVRDYRNWVAHGRRDRPKNAVDPQTAYDRLRQFLTALGITTGPEAGSPPQGGNGLR